MIKLFNRLSNRRVKSLLSGFLTLMLGTTILTPSADARLIFTTEEDGAEYDTYTLDVDGTVNPGDNTDLSLIFGANIGEELRYNDSLGYFVLTNSLNLEGNELQEFKIGSSAGAPVVCNAGNVAYTYYDTTTASVMICNETSPGSGSYAFDSVEDLTTGSITTTEILDGTIATVDIADNAVTTDQIGTAGLADANSLLGTDASGNPQWEDKSDFVSSTLTSGQILLGNGSNVATGVTLSGDVTIDNTGVASIQDDAVDSAAIAANAVDTAELADDAVTSGKILDGTIVQADLAADSVNSAKILDGSITADDLAADSVTSSEIAVDAVGSSEIATDAVGASEIAADAVGASELADNAVDTAALQNDAVTSAKIADGAVSGGLGGQITDASVTADDLASNSVDSDEIATNAVGALELADNAVDTNAVQDDAITTAKIGTAGAGDSNKVLTTDGSGNPQWEDRSAFATSSLSSGSIFVGNATNDAVGVTLFGDGAIANTGQFTIQDDAVDGTDISLAGEAEGDLMYFDGTDWVNLGIGTAGQVLQTNGGATAPEWAAAAAGNFAGLSDTNLTALVDGQVAVYDADTGEWINVAVSGDLTFDDTGDMQIIADAVTAAEIADGAVSGGLGGVITDESITADDLATDSVGSDEIATDAVGSAEIAADAVGASELDLVDVTLSDFANDLALNDSQVFVGDGTNVATGVSITGDATLANNGTLSLATDSVDSDEIVANAVDTAELADDAVTSGKILDGTIATADLADNSVDGSKLGIGTTAGDTLYFDGTDWVSLGIGSAGQVLQTNAGATAPEWATAVSTFEGQTDTNFAALANGDITVYDLVNTEWVNVAIGGDATIDETGDLQIAADAVTAAEIATGAVGTDEIADGTITATDLDAAFEITGAEITDGTIGVADLGTGSVGSDEIIDGSVDISDDTNLAAGTGATLTGDTISVDLGTTIDTTEIELDTIIADDIATGAVTTDEILDATIGAADLADGSVNGGLAGVITDGSITADDLATGSVDSDEIATDAVGSAEIAADAVTAAELADNAVDTAAIATDAVDGTKISLTGETAGDLMYFDGTNWVNLGIGTAGQVLQTNVGEDAPEWAAAAAGNFAGLSDTNLAALADGQVTVYDADTGNWINVDVSGDATFDDTGDLQIIADAVTAAEIATGAVTTTEILDATIGAADLADGSVNGGLDGVITDGSITADDLGTDSVDSDEIAADAVTASELADNAVDNAAIADDAVTTAEIGTAGLADANSVLTTDAAGDPLWEDRSNFGTSSLTSGNIFVGNGSNVATDVTMSGDATIDNTGALSLAADSVDSAEIAADAVTASEIATGAVTTTEILDATIGAADLADGSVNGGLNGVITDGSITADDLGTDSVDSDEIAADAVGDSEIDYTAVTLSDFTNDAGLLENTLTDTQIFVGNGSNEATGVALSGDATIDNTGALSLAADSVDTAEIATDAVTDAELADTAVDTAAIQDNAVTSAKIADATITAADLATDSVDSDEIATGAVTTTEILDATIATADIADGAITGGTGGVISDGTITADDLGTDSVDTDEIATDAVTTDEILDGTITQADREEVETFHTIAPEFANFTLKADGSNNRGTFEASHDATTDRNFYQWSTRRSSELNDYDLVLQWMVPENFTGFSDTNPEIEIDFKTNTTALADNRLDVISLLDTNGSSVALTGNTGLVSGVADTWVDDSDITFAGGTFTPGEYITMTFRFASQGAGGTSTNPVFLGPVKFNIKTQ